MLYNCVSLISLRLNSFSLTSESDYKDMFKYCNNSLIYCVDNSLSLTAESILNSFTEDCQNTCFSNSKLLIIEEKRSVLNCDESYKYEYNGICYKKSPELWKVYKIIYV